MFDYLIVGAGFAGSVLAERLARAGKKRVMLCDRRPHIAGSRRPESHARAGCRDDTADVFASGCRRAGDRRHRLRIKWNLDHRRGGNACPDLGQQHRPTVTSTQARDNGEAGSPWGPAPLGKRYFRGC